MASAYRPAGLNRAWPNSEMPRYSEVPRSHDAADPGMRSETTSPSFTRSGRSMIASKSEVARTLIVDDDAGVLRAFRHCLEDAGHQVVTAADAEQVEDLVQREVFDLCFLDLMLGNVSGLDLLPRLRQMAPWMRVVIVTAHSSVDSALDALRAGAADYLIKPCSVDQLRLAATRQMQARRLEQRIEALEAQSGEQATSEMDSANPAMKAVIETVRKVADTDATVLILGESGTGKGIAARMIHRLSPRAGENLVTVSCPSLSAELLESELFGHRKGAFTGATENKLGRVDQAEGGTLFLDEVGDVPLKLQPKLLRFIQDREYERVGDPVTRRANVRIVAATNRDLAVMVRDGQFREDLLYRLNVISIDMPALRERIEDLPALTEDFLLRYAGSYHRSARGLTPMALQVIQMYPWPGNIRELQNVIERAVILCPSEQVDVEHLSVAENNVRPMQPRIGEALSLEQIEKAHIRGVLARTSSLDSAAKILDIDVSTLYRKRKQYAL